MRYLRAWAMSLSMLAMGAYAAMADEPKAAPEAAPAAPEVVTTEPAAPAQVSGQLAIKFEADAEGKVSREKFLADNATENTAVKSMIEAFANRVDANKDGFLTTDEVKALNSGPSNPSAAEQSMNLQMRPGPDGRISREQFLKDNQQEDPTRNAILDQVFAQLDTDSDGYVTVAEMMAQGEVSASAKAEPDAQPASAEEPKAAPEKAKAAPEEPKAEPEAAKAAPEAAPVAKPEAPKAAPKGGMQLKMRPGPDGRITRGQFLKDNPEADPAIIEKIIAQLDTDKDGALTIAELMAQAKPANPEAAPATAAAPAAPASDDEPEGDLPLPEVTAAPEAEDCPYAVVISSKTAAMPEWRAVADALLKKHNGKLVVYEGSVVKSLPELARLHPRYTAFVARPEILGRIFVARVHRLTRHLNSDPYTDTIWGIVSAATPEGALRMAEATEPQVVRRAIGLTGINHGLFDQALTISDAGMGNWMRKKADGTEEKGNDGSADRTRMFVETFSSMNPDLIVGSGHATERNLEMSYSRGNTEIRGGKWYGLVNWRTRSETPLLIETNSTPRVFLGAGNCLIGNFKKSTQSMPAVLINDYGFNQFVGYTVPTWYGKGGWGTLNMWCNLPGTYSLAEAWFFNNQAITEELIRRYPMSSSRSLNVTERGEGLDFGMMMSGGDKDESGMLWDRDVVAFYGDPAQRVLLDGQKQPPGVAFRMRSEKDVHTLDVAIAPDCKVKGGWIASYFPQRIPGKIEITAGQEYEPLITENFIVLRKADYTPGKKYSVAFKATP